MRIQVKVKPNARISRFEQSEDGTWIAHIKAVPVDGKANAELIRLVATHFDRSKSDVEIKSGATGRMKWIEIAD